MSQIPGNITKMLSDISASQEALELAEEIFNNYRAFDMETQVDRIKQLIIKSQTDDLPKCFFDYLNEITAEIKNEFMKKVVDATS